MQGPPGPPGPPGPKGEVTVYLLSMLVASHNHVWLKLKDGATLSLEN